MSLDRPKFDAWISRLGLGAAHPAEPALIAAEAAFLAAHSGKVGRVELLSEVEQALPPSLRNASFTKGAAFGLALALATEARS